MQNRLLAENSVLLTELIQVMSAMQIADANRQLKGIANPIRPGALCGREGKELSIVLGSARSKGGAMPTITIEVTEEQLEARRQLKIIGQLCAAEERGDEAAVLELNKQFAPLASTLLHAKEVAGADWIRKEGYDTRHADEKYGPGWLDE